jgi:hypothetical protein
LRGLKNQKSKKQYPEKVFKLASEELVNCERGETE